MRTFFNGLLIGAVIGIVFGAFTTPSGKETRNMFNEKRRRVQAGAQNIVGKVGSGVTGILKR